MKRESSKSSDKRTKAGPSRRLKVGRPQKRAAHRTAIVDLTERQQAEEALHDSEERFRQLAENIEEVFWLSNPEKDKIIYISSGYEKIWGRTCESLYASPRNWLEAIHPEDRDRVLGAALTKQVSGQYDESYRIQRPDGSIRWIRDRAFPVRDKTGAIYRIAGIAEDITERKRAEELAQKAERRYRKLFEEAPVMYVISRNQGGVPIVEDCNELFLQTLGYTRAEVLERPFAGFYTPASRLQLLEGGYQQALEGRLAVQERDLVTRGGHIIKTLLHAVPEIDSDGHVSGTRAMYVDITERKRAEEALRASETRFRILVETMNEGLVQNNANFTIAYVNKKLCQMLGYAQEELVGQQSDGFYDETNRKMLREQMALRRQGIEQAYEIGIKCKDGRNLPVIVSPKTLFDREGNFAGSFAVVTDISRRKQMEEELRVSRERLHALSANLYSLQEKERAAIARDVHDEFGQVLTSLKMDLTLLERKIKTAAATDLSSLLPTITAMKGTIDATIDKLTRLITELRPMVFANLLVALEWQIEEFQKRTGLPVAFNAGVDEIPLAQEHAIAVFRIFQESLTNIARHAQATQVQVEIHEDPPNVFIEIIDDGIGMTPEKLAMTKTFGVLGMCERALIFNGEVDIISAPAKGTMVKIKIPMGNDHDQDHDC